MMPHKSKDQWKVQLKLETKSALKIIQILDLTESHVLMFLRKSKL